MGDVGDMGRAIREHTREKHAEWHRRNRGRLEKSGIPFTDRGETLLFREEGKPMVDFYPSTGRWRVPNENLKTFSGGAGKFLKWYERQKRDVRSDI